MPLATLVRRYVPLAVLLLPLAAHAQGTPHTLSERIGPTLDPTERAYFGLFPRHQEGFVEATFHPRGDSVEVRIRRRVGGAERVEGLTLSAEHAAEAGRYVDTFEDHPIAVRNPHWRQDLDVYDPRVFVPYAGRDRRVRAEVAGGLYTGQLLYAGDSLLVLAPHVRPRDPLQGGAFTLRHDEVAVVCYDDVVRRGSRWLLPYAAAGVGAAGVQAAYLLEGEPPAITTRLVATIFAASLGYTAMRGVARDRERCGTLPGALPALRTWSHYGAVQPLEFPGEPALAAHPRPAPRAGTARPRARAHEWFSAGLTAGVKALGRDAEAYTQSIRLFPEPTVVFSDRRTAVLGAPTPFQLDVAIRPLRYFRFGLQLRRDEAPANPDEPLVEYVSVTPGTVRGYAEGVLPLLRSGDVRLETSLGVGLERNARRVAQRFPERSPAGGTVNVPLVPTLYEFEEAGGNLFVQGALEVYTSSRTSFFVQGSWRDLPPIEVPLAGVDHRNQAGTRIITVAPHAVTFGYTEFAVGTRFHF